MATYEPYGFYSILEWVSFGLAIWIVVVLIGKMNDRFGKARWYRRDSGRRDRVVTALEQSAKGFIYMMLALATLSFVFWYILPFPISALLNYDVPVSFWARVVLLGLAGLSLLAAVACKIVASVKNRKLNHSVPMGPVALPGTGVQ